jgi:formyltetrahydrofolate synthetase
MSDKKEVSNNELMELITKMYSDTTNKLDGLTKKVTELSNQVDKNTNSIVNIENTLTKKIDILFEAREMDREKLESIENKVDKLIKKTDTQDFEIRMIKKKA